MCRWDTDTLRSSPYSVFSPLFGVPGIMYGGGRGLEVDGSGGIDGVVGLTIHLTTHMYDESTATYDDECSKEPAEVVSE